jgi:hypothetical protein
MTKPNPYNVPPSRIMQALADNRDALAALVNRYAAAAFRQRDALLTLGAEHGRLDSIECQAWHSACRHWEGVATGLSLALAAIDASQRGKKDARVSCHKAPVNPHPYETEVELLAELGQAAKRRAARVPNCYPETGDTPNNISPPTGER